MGEIRNYFAKHIWMEIIRQKGQRAERQAKEVIANQKHHIEPSENIILHASEDLNTGKLSKLIRWLRK